MTIMQPSCLHPSTWDLAHSGCLPFLPIIKGILEAVGGWLLLFQVRQAVPVLTDPYRPEVLPQVQSSLIPLHIKFPSVFSTHISLIDS